MTDRLIYAQLATDHRRVFPLSQQPISRHQLTHDLLRDVSLPRRFLVAMILSSLPAHSMGRKTLIHPGLTKRGRATTIVELL
jgi:hypothetical protein